MNLDEAQQYLRESRLHDEIKRLRALVAKLQRFATHEDHCLWKMGMEASQCTCGLNAALGFADCPEPSPALPPNTAELLLALHEEFYGGPRANADAFRILPKVVQALTRSRAIP